MSLQHLGITRQLQHLHNKPSCAVVVKQHRRVSPFLKRLKLSHALVDINKNLRPIDRRRCQFLDHLADVDTNVIGGVLDIWSQLQDFESESEAIARQRHQSLRDLPI